MSTYSVRCRVDACRHRKVIGRDPATYQRPPRCPMCGSLNGWRVEQRAYNKRGLCTCSGPVGRDGPYPHRTTHPLCDQHPQGMLNQARARGLSDDDIPLEAFGTVCTTDEAPF